MSQEPNEQEISLRVSLLGEVLIFSQIEQNLLEVIAKALIPVALTKDEVLFRKGDSSRSMYIVNQGQVKVHLKDYVFTILGPREIFGEYALLDEGERSASVTSIGETSLYELAKDDFDHIVEQQPEIKESILKMLLLRLREQNTWEERLAVRNAEIEQQKSELEKLNEEIQAQRDLKDKFFSIISHDLRGPVSSFQGVSSVIKFYIKEARYEDLNRMSDEIDKSVFHLSALLDNLLNWASQQQSQIPYSPEMIPIGEMIGGLIDTFQTTAMAKNISLHHQIDGDMKVWGDYNTVATIFRNLINNALKFTPDEGTIEISCSANRGCNEILIRDSGVGIEADRLKNLFVLKDKQTTFGTKGEKGVGLGLQLVYEFTKMNKGEVRVNSIKGEGTTFIITLPNQEDQVASAS